MPWIGGAIAAGGSILGGLMGSDASDRAAQAQMAATQAAIAEQRRQYDQNRTDQAPWRDTGGKAITRLSYLLGLNNATSPGTPGTPGHWEKSTIVNPNMEMETAQNWVDGTPGTPGAAGDPNDPAYGSLMRDFTMADRDADPVYQSGLQFGLDEGRKGINERAIAGGGYDSGATLKALTRFGNDYGSTKAAGAYDRFNTNKSNKFNMLSGVSGAGQVATNATGAAGQNSANNISELLTGGGNANAAGIVGGANAWGNAFGGVGTAVQGYQNNKILQALLPKRISMGPNGGGGDFNTDYSQWG